MSENPFRRRILELASRRWGRGLPMTDGASCLALDCKVFLPHSGVGRNTPAFSSAEEDFLARFIDGSSRNSLGPRVVIFQWNDFAWRTFDEVITLLEDAAEAWDKEYGTVPVEELAGVASE